MAREEAWEDYCEGGYHPMQIGDTFSDGRYVVLRKLGFGHFSTVWLAKDTKYSRHVALKVNKSGDTFAETATDEIRLLQRIHTSSIPPTTPSPSNPYPPLSPSQTHAGRSHVVSLLDHFTHDGPNGRHICEVFEILGESLLDFCNRYEYKGVPMNLVKQISKQLLLGLDYLHRCCGIIHTDLKPENILLSYDDMESVIREELSLSSSSSSTSPPRTKVYRCSPPSSSQSQKNDDHTDILPFRISSVVITSSQPLTFPRKSLEKLTRLTGSVMEQMARLDLGGEISFPICLLCWGFTRLTWMLRTLLCANIIIASLPSPPVSESGLSAVEVQVSTTTNDNITTIESSFSDVKLASRTDTITVKIADIGNATWIEQHFTDDIQSRQFRCPEAIIGAPWGPTADIWSLACIIFELISGGDFLFNPKPTSSYNKDDDHLAQIIELMGDFPRHVKFLGKYSKEFFNSFGDLRYIPKSKINPWPLRSVLQEKYSFSFIESNEIAEFLEPMLRLDPYRRAKAIEMLSHKWLEGIVLESEKRVERRQRGVKKAGTGNEGEDVNVEDDSERVVWEEDAMKPVVDVIELREKLKEKEHRHHNVATLSNDVLKKPGRLEDID
ncbi:kinase-like domain-containing protein [Abortiporus biennis]|nr:kinase-like domain-containing protein [Abortiporus biennis]